MQLCPFTSPHKFFFMKGYLLLVIFLLTITGVKAQYQHDSIRVEYGYLHFYTKGSGKPVVLLQGGPGFSSYYMRSIADSIPDHQCILIDYQGTGRSQYRVADTNWVNINTITGDIERVRSKLQIDKWAVLGHSYGGMFALNYAKTYPQHIERLVLISSAGTNNQFQHYYSDNIALRLTGEDKKALSQIQSNKDLSAEEKGLQSMLTAINALFYDRTKVPAFLQNIPVDKPAQVHNKAFFNAYVHRSDFFQFDISKEVLTLTIPVRTIEGRQDPGNDGQQLLLNERMKNAKITFIERSGHFPWAEQPEVFFNALKGYLND